MAGHPQNKLDTGLDSLVVPTTLLEQKTSAREHGL